MVYQINLKTGISKSLISAGINRTLIIEIKQKHLENLEITGTEEKK